MVVGLKTYMMQHPEAYYKVDIKDLVQQYRKATGSKEVLVVTSGNAIKHRLYKGLNWVCGGQYKEFKESIQRFVESFQAIGVHLIVFFEGATSSQKRPMWVARRKNNIKEAADILYKIENESFESCERESFYVPAGLATFAQQILRLVCKCDVRYALGECDEEIAEFGRKDNCFLYIGQDTDFVIYKAFTHFIDINDLDLNSLTGYKFDPCGLANSLCIPSAQLPIFATLCGNDYINCKEELNDFHRSILRKFSTRPKKTYRMAVLDAVASYVQTLPQGDRLYTALPEVAKKVFGNTNRTVDLERSVKSYLPSPPGLKQIEEHPHPTTEWEEILEKARTTFSYGEARNNYVVLNKEPGQMSSALEDYGKNADLPMTANLYSPLRRRTYGILLMERPGGPGLVEEWVCTGLDSLKNPAFVTPIMPPPELHPGLLALWGEPDGEGQAEPEDIVDIRWRLFAHTVSPSLDVGELRGLVGEGLSHLVVPTVILKYLREALPAQPSDACPQYLADWELEALAIQAVLLASTDPKKVIVPMPYDARGVRIATVFMRGVSQTLMLLATCGFPIPMKDAMPWLFFDGKLFHQKYLGMRNEKHIESLCVNQDGNSMMQDFLKVKKIALESLQ